MSTSNNPYTVIARLAERGSTQYTEQRGLTLFQGSSSRTPEGCAAIQNALNYKDILDHHGRFAAS